MRRVSALGVSLLALALVGWPGTSSAQDTKTARGTVTAMAADSLTVKVGTNDMKFTIDPQTTVVARGAGTAQRRSEGAGQAGPKLGEVVKTGEAVIVTYRESGGTMRATRVQVVSSAGSGGGSASGAKPAAAANPTRTSSGTVKSVSATSLTITAAGGKDMTFTVDGSTNVVARGAGTRGRATGGKLVLTDVVKTGQRVSVSYHDMNGAMHASSVRVVPQ